ncbi:hypothetical protein ACFVJS_22675 [Nocardioides sp. NPDC057772]|uniref:hypothetical protein n=1 Tax=Nocardioides sp. NPDC057772 TaxID=3346245 RepID=UPI0036729E0E
MTTPLVVTVRPASGLVVPVPWMSAIATGSVVVVARAVGMATAPMPATAAVRPTTEPSTWRAENMDDSPRVEG